jgi:hypothetical protein
MNSMSRTSFLDDLWQRASAAWLSTTSRITQDGALGD